MALIIYIMILIYSLSRFYDLTSLALFQGCEWYGYITFSFVHLSFFHLAFNLICLCSLYKAIRMYLDKRNIAFMTVISVLLAAVISNMDKPTVGCSGAIFSMLGMYIDILWSFNVKGRKKFTILTSLLIIFQTVTGFNRINWEIHLFAFLLGFYAMNTYLYGQSYYRLAKTYFGKRKKE